jgi:hypothetical protein
MGQAKVRREALRLKLLEKSKEWEFPPSSWEAEVCAELKEDDVVVVPRVASAELDWMRMPTNQCHANVNWYVENDPEKKSLAVTGWWVQWPNFVLHSVVERAGKLFCITPSPLEDKEIPFIPDTKISWIEDGKVYSAFRSGRKIGPGVRVFPAFTIAQSAIVRERLLSGCDPLKAGDFTDEEMEELRQRHIEGRV